jgi:CheY-like chemotaxis protein
MILNERPAATAGHRVLLADDDDAVRDMMTATLLHKGFDVVAAANVTEALKLVEADHHRELRRVDH